ncbi:MAG TPA: thioredoxin family protein [Armatimonadetes bacterium]|nr:thioredoxin family protein [Armatimonadota bacterium]
MVTITIIKAPTPCPQCHLAEQVAQQVAENYPGEVAVKVLSVLDEEADQYGVVMTPTVMVDDVIVSVRKAPRRERLAALIARKLGCLPNT